MSDIFNKKHLEELIKFSDKNPDNKLSVEIYEYVSIYESNIVVYSSFVSVKDLVLAMSQYPTDEKNIGNNYILLIEGVRPKSSVYPYLYIYPRKGILDIFGIPMVNIKNLSFLTI